MKKYKEVNSMGLMDVYYYSGYYFDEDELIEWCVEEGVKPSVLGEGKEEGILICCPLFGDIDLDDYLRGKFDILDEAFEFSEDVKKKMEELEVLLGKEIIGYDEYAIPSLALLEYLDKEYDKRVNWYEEHNE